MRWSPTACPKDSVFSRCILTVAVAEFKKINLKSFRAIMEILFKKPGWTLKAVALLPCLLSFAFSTQVALAQADQGTSAPIAYAYVTTGPSEISENRSKPTAGPPFPQIVAYSVASDGKLTFLQDTFAPFMFTGGVASKKFFFAFALAQDSGLFSDAHVSSYAIEPTGRLKYAATTSVIKSPDWCYSEPGLLMGIGVTAIQIDSSGQTLYVPVAKCAGGGVPAICTEDLICEQGLESFKIESNGELTYLGVSSFHGYGGPVVTLGNNKFGYVAGSNTAPYTTVYTREGNGFMTLNGDSIESPGKGVYPIVMANDSSDHMAISWSNGDLGSYSASSNGNLTTTNKKMLSVPSLLMSISPNNEFLAVASGGVQVFRFNGSGPITKLSERLLGGVSMNGMAWDTHGHLFTISTFKDIYVETVTSTGVTPAPGSPYVPGEVEGSTAGYSISVVPAE